MLRVYARSRNRTKGCWQYAGVEDGQTGKMRDLRAQLWLILRQLHVILHTAGLNESLIVDVRVFLLGMLRNFAVMNEVYGAYFGGTVPARTTVEVVGFPSDVLAELEVVATGRITWRD